MSYLDWDIYGAGVQSIIDLELSKRCKLAGLEWMLYNGEAALVDSQIIADFRRYGALQYSEGGFVLRSDINLTNCYYLQRSITPADGWLLTKVVAGVRMDLWSAPTTHAPEDWVRVRFRIDGWQLAVHEWIDGTWEGIVLVEDTEQSHASGHAGLFGANPDPTGSMLFDNVEIATKV